MIYFLLYRFYIQIFQTWKAIPFETLYNSKARRWILWWWIVTAPSLSKRCSKVDIKSRYTICNALWWRLLILLLSPLLQNIHTSGQYENCEIKNVDISIFLLFNGSMVHCLDNAFNFFPAFLQMDSMWPVNVSLESISIPKSFTFSDSMTSAFSMLAIMVSCLKPLVIIWHLSGFNIGKPVNSNFGIFF